VQLEFGLVADCLVFQVVELTFVLVADELGFPLMGHDLVPGLPLVPN
jgi:hypothetical protein